MWYSTHKSKYNSHVIQNIFGFISLQYKYKMIEENDN